MEWKVKVINNQYEKRVLYFPSSPSLPLSLYASVEITETSFRKDIEEMEKEKDIVGKRIERMQRKVEGMPNMEVWVSMLVIIVHKYQKIEAFC